MLGKIETPIFILAFFYTLIICFCLILVGLLFVSLSGVKQFVEQGQVKLVTRHCQVYLDNGHEDDYRGCYRQAITYYEKNK